MNKLKLVKSIDGEYKLVKMKDINMKALSEEENDDFIVTHIDEEELKPASIKNEPVEQVKVSFARFAQLVSRGDIEDIILANPHEHVVINTNLLAELATPSEEVEERKIPVIFSIGLVVGIVLTYILFKYL